jgi:hypothetical protein
MYNAFGYRIATEGLVQHRLVSKRGFLHVRYLSSLHNWVLLHSFVVTRSASSRGVIGYVRRPLNPTVCKVIGGLSTDGLLSDFAENFDSSDFFQTFRKNITDIQLPNKT